MKKIPVKFKRYKWNIELKIYHTNNQYISIPIHPSYKHKSLIKRKFKHNKQLKDKRCLHDKTFELIPPPPPGAAYMRQQTGSSLVQVMACRLFGDKPLPGPIVNWTLKNKLQWNSN